MAATAVIRLPATVLLLSGLLLFVLSLTIYRAPAARGRALLLVYGLLGVVLFTWGGRTATQPLRERAFWQEGALVAVGRWFNVRPAQVVLLALALPLSYLAYLGGGDGLKAVQPWASAVAWLAALLAVVAGAQGRTTAVAQPLSWSDRLLSVGLFALAFLFRGTILENLPTTLAGDEASAGLAAVRFLTGESDNLFGLGWFSFPNFYFGVQSLGIGALGQTAEGLRISSALAGAVTVVVVYWMARALFGRLNGLLAALYLTAAHYHIQFSRIGLNNIWDGLYLSLAIGGLWRGWTRGWRNGFVLAGLALGVGQYFYVSFRVVPILFLIWAGVAFWREREQFRARWPDFLLAGYVALVAFLPLLVLFVRRPAELNAPLARVSIFNGWMTQEMAQTGLSAAGVFFNQVRLTALGFAVEPLRHWYDPGVPLLLAVPAALFILGLLWSLYAFDLRTLLLLLPVAAVTLLGGLSQDAPASQRFVLAMPAVAVLVARPLSETAEWLRAYWPAQRRLIGVVALVAMVAVMMGDLRYYFTEVYDSYVLGGDNTLVATELAHYLQGHPIPVQDVYFAGLPRMGYFSHSTLPYLAPAMVGHDLEGPLTASPDLGLTRPTIFVFLPERLGELAAIETAYPDGRLHEFTTQRGPERFLLFVTYEVTRPQQ